MKNEFPFDHHGISGAITIQLHKNDTLDSFSKRYIPGYDPSRYEVVALRMYAGKEVIITVYALDKQGPHDGEHLPVKKFKVEGMPVERLFSYIRAFNFTVSSGNYDIENMRMVDEQIS